MSHSRPTLADVAAEAGVSVSTASLAFSGSGPIADATRERVLVAAQRLGYTGPSALGRSLRRGRSGIVGVVLGDQLRRAFRDPVAVQVLDGVARVLAERGAGVLLLPGGTDGGGEDTAEGPSTTPGTHAAAAPPLVETAAMDAAIVVWGSLTADAATAALERRGIPIVLGEGPAGGAHPAVGIDDRAGTAELVRHLVGLGHRRIGAVTLPFDDARRCGHVDEARLAQLDWVPTAHRLAGFHDTGLDPVATVEATASLVEAGAEAARLVLDVADPPTAVVAQSDLLAAGTLIAARELGLRVPEDVSVAGFDGLDLPWLAPDVLTTVAQPLAAKGEAMARAVLALLDGEQPADEVLAVELRVGTTTAPPRAGA